MEINYVFRLKTAHEKLLDKIPDTDYSWMGLFKKGYRLQWYNPYKKSWIDFKCLTQIDVVKAFGHAIRYKHSIQS